MPKIYEFRTPQGHFELYGVRGIVTGAGKTSTTHVSGGGSTSNGGYVSVSSTSTIHDQIFIVDKNGVEHALQLSNWNFPAKTDHDVSAFWLTKSGTRFTFWHDEYVAVSNHTISNTLFKTNDQLKAIFQSKWGCLLPIVLIICLFFVGYAVNFVSVLYEQQKVNTSLWDKNYVDDYVKISQYNDHTRAQSTLALGVVLIVISIAIIAVYNIVQRKRVKTAIGLLKQAILDSEYY